jgi:hypothetical protein
MMSVDGGTLHLCQNQHTMCKGGMILASKVADELNNNAGSD